MPEKWAYVWSVVYGVIYGLGLALICGLGVEGDVLWSVRCSILHVRRGLKMCSLLVSLSQIVTARCYFFV